MTDNMITDIEQLVEGGVYKLDFGCSINSIIRDKYKYYIYNGYKKLDHAHFHEFMSTIKCFQKPVLAISRLDNDDICSCCNKLTIYKFIASGFINDKGRLETYNIYKITSDDDLYGYDDFSFNIYKTDK